LGLLAAIHSGCSKPETPVSIGNREKILHFSVGSEPTDLDPHIVTGLGEAKIIPALFDSLVTLDPVTLQPAPALAERWTVSPDGLTYSFHLRADAKWSNGEPLTAQDCVESWRRVLTPTLGADYAYLLYSIRGAETYHKGRNSDPSLLGLAAPDPRTFVVTLEHPTAYFLLLLINSPFRPVNVRAIAAHGDPYRRGNAWTKPGKIVTSGPFELREWSPNQHVMVAKSARYWNRAKISLNGIYFYPIESLDAEERAFRRGQLHITWGLPVAKARAYRAEKSPYLRADPYLDTYFFRFNTTKGPLDRREIRRALQLAIDRAALTERVLQGGQQPATSVVHPGIPNYDISRQSLHDVASAQKLLADAGHAGGAGLPPIEILHQNNETVRLVAEAVQEMWRRELGLQVSIRNQEYKVVFADRRAGNYQILLSDWIGDYLDATTFLDLWRSDSGNNHTRWGDPGFDRLMNEAARTADAAQRARLLREAEELMLAEAPIAPLFYNPHVYLVQSSVSGWKPTPSDSIDYQHVSLVE
jgi:oligopeptide transport system substrate-binding protein